MAVCPHCGCKGKKAPHVQIHDRATAEEFCWRDLICGSCGLPFRSYPVKGQSGRDPSPRHPNDEEERIDT